MESYTEYAFTMASMDFGDIYGKNQGLLMFASLSFATYQPYPDPAVPPGSSLENSYVTPTPPHKTSQAAEC